MRRAAAVALALLVVTSPVPAGAQPPDANAVLRGAGVDVPRGGAEAAFDQGLTGPTPVPPGAFGALLVGMGPVGTTARVRSAYAFGVLAGRSARHVPPSELKGAGIALLQMIVSEDRRARIAGTRVAGHVFAAPIDGGPTPERPTGLLTAIAQQLNQNRKDERIAAMEALGLLRETAVLAALTDAWQRAGERGDRDLGAAALEAIARLGDPSSRSLAEALPEHPWASRDDEAGLAVAFARARFLKDGSMARIEAAVDDRSLGARARAYLAELRAPVAP